MAKCLCLLAMEKLHVSAYSGHLQVSCQNLKMAAIGRDMYVVFPLLINTII